VVCLCADFVAPLPGMGVALRSNGSRVHFLLLVGRWNLTTVGGKTWAEAHCAPRPKALVQYGSRPNPMGLPKEP
jgi:hypothetical protein